MNSNFISFQFYSFSTNAKRIIIHAFYEILTFPKTSFLFIKSPSKIWSHLPCISCSYYRWTFWALVNGQFFHKYTRSSPMLPTRRYSQATLSLSPTTSFSLSTKSFLLNYKHAAISHISPTHTFLGSHLHPATVPFLCSPLEQNSSKEWCLPVVSNSSPIILS